MKRTIYFLFIAVLFIGCKTATKSEKAILEYMREQTGVPGLEIEFTEVRIEKQTVQDSIDILRAKYEQELKEKKERIKTLEEGIKQNEKELENTQKKNEIYAFYQQILRMDKQELKIWQEKVILDEGIRYKGQDKNKILVTIVHCRLTSLLNPVLKAKQTKEGSFVLSADETVCLRQLN